MSNHQPPDTNHLATPNPQSPIPNHQLCATPNPQSPIPNHWRLYAALYRPPRAEDGGELAAIAREFSPRYQLHHPDLVVIDVAGLHRLLGPARAIGDELRKAVSTHGIRAHVAIASTQAAAIVLAHTRPGLTVIAPGDEATALAPTAIGILEKITHHAGTPRPPSTPRKNDPQHSASSALAAFHRWGVRTLGELAALPDAELVSRFGRAAVAWQMLARGVDQRPLIPTLEDERFEAALELEWPIEGLEPLSFVLTRLLEPLCTRLERRDRGAAVLHVLLDLVTNTVHPCRLELPTPMRDVRALRTLALLDLESHPPDAAIDRVTVVIDPTPGRVLQHRLFTRAHPTPEQLSTLLARLGAVIGQDRVGSPTVVDTYRPGAFGMVRFATEHGAETSEVGSRKFASSERREDSHVGLRQTSNFKLQTSQYPLAAFRRCRQPVPARATVGTDGRPVRITTDRRGYTGGAVVQCAGPWRTSGDWWMSKSEVRSQNDLRPPGGGLSQTSNFKLQTSGCWDRDEWDVALGDGAVYRVFRDRSTDAWYIDAIAD
jgi:protein ImuB